ncbi:MAG TPA: hypothetical protein VF669_20850, partial [Tepidisphaeraceae bacterium]
GEDFRAASAFLAHEALHTDTSNALYEEEFANVAEIMVYAQQALVDKTFLSGQTALVNRENERLYAMLESGRAIFPYVGLLQGAIRNSTPSGVFLGGISNPSDGKGRYISFSNFVEREYQLRGSPANPTPGNAILNQYYANMKGTAAPAGLQFSQSLIQDIDGFQQIIGTKQAITLAGALRLGLS